MIKKCIVLFLIGLFPLFLMTPELKKVDEDIKKQEEMDYFEEYYYQASELTKSLVDNFKILLEKKPEKYGFIRDKINEYDPGMQIDIDEIKDGQALYLKGLYNLKFGNEIFDLVIEKIPEEEISKDWEEIDGEH